MATMIQGWPYSQICEYRYLYFPDFRIIPSSDLDTHCFMPSTTKSTRSAANKQYQSTSDIAFVVAWCEKAQPEQAITSPPAVATQHVYEQFLVITTIHSYFQKLPLYKNH